MESINFGNVCGTLFFKIYEFLKFMVPQYILSKFILFNIYYKPTKIYISKIYPNQNLSDPPIFSRARYIYQGTVIRKIFWAILIFVACDFACCQRSSVRVRVCALWVTKLQQLLSVCVCQLVQVCGVCLVFVRTKINIAQKIFLDKVF